MDCKTALRMIEVCRPDAADLADPELAPVSAHLEQCPECLRRFRTRQAWDDRLAQVVQSVPVPLGLRERILAKLDRPVDRHRVRTLRLLFPLAGAAALVILSVSAALLSRSGRHPSAPQVELLDNIAVRFADAPLDSELPVPAKLSRAEQVAQWCKKELQVVGVLPANCPVHGLSRVARASLARSWVAVLRYDDPRAPGTRDVDVFVCPNTLLQLEDVGEHPRLARTRTRNLEVVAWVEGDITYVAVCRGWLPEEWESLRHQPRGPEVI
jgi:hypothetical protein